MRRIYDLELFEQLNEEYRSKPIWKASVPQVPPSADAETRDRTRREVERIQNAKKVSRIAADVDLRGKEVLELGCGHGFLSAALARDAKLARAIGVDVKAYSGWDEHDDARVEFIRGDLSVDELLPAESVDAVVSTVAFEHIERPLQMLQALHRVLRRRGCAWLFFNLYRGRNASHVYREVFFPWPHLLFDDDVCIAFYEKHHGVKRKFSWVNRMTVAHYLHSSHELGFRIAAARLDMAPIDVAFYGRFEDKLGRYPALDLKTNFMTLVLDKSANGDLGAIPDVGYLRAQLELDAELRGG